MIASRHIQFLVVLAGCLLAIFVGGNIVTLPINGLFVILAGLAVMIWALFAGSYWWVTAFSVGGIGGTFYVGFKIYPYEAGLALSFLALVPLILAQDLRAFQPNRRRLPAIFYITALYVMVRLLIDVVPAVGFRGNLSRIFLGYTWIFVLGFLFHLYGSFSAARAAVLIGFTFLFIRVLAGIVGYVANIPLYIPGINYVLSFSGADSLIPMRAVAMGLLINTIVLFHCSRSPVIKTLLLPVFAFSGVMVVLGASRFQTLVMILTGISYLVWSRRWIPLLFLGIITSFALAFINLAPESLSYLPPGAGRAASGLVFTKNVSQEDFATTASDEWHSDLRAEGWRRATSSPTEFLFGNGIVPSLDLTSDLRLKVDPRTVLENAANLGAYENGFFAVVGTVGVVGFTLYLLLFYKFWKETFPYIIRRPAGTFWEGILFWGWFSSISWYVTCFFAGSSPSAEILMMLMAWNLVHEGKLDEGLPVASSFESAGYQAPVRAGLLTPARVRG